MNQRKAKQLRKEYYGDYSPRFRKLFMVSTTRQVIADEKRQGYQNLKRAYNEARARGEAING